ncbi:putative sugar nucleotidyl transferase [Fodinibius salinus]|nr:putative sugar nucleotidyl transferase [Fodinibius salinus]
MQICFFEDDRCDAFQPLTLTRPVDNLRIGIDTISEKWKKALGTSAKSRLLRTELAEVFSRGKIASNESCLWINSRYLPSDNLVERIKDLGDGQCLKHNKTIIAARVTGSDSKLWHKKNSPNFSNLFVLESPDFTSITHLWDLLQLNGQEIEQDIARYTIPKPSSGTKAGNVELQHPENIYIQEGATIESGCVLIADDGPIFIGRNATVMAGTHIRGPAAICKDAVIKMGAKIYGNTTVGPVCKVGGEVNTTIFHSYSNKGHDGFVGHSLIGQWCNLGADTNTSNLKNNYSSIRINKWSDRQEIETGQQFLGTIMGDHCKTAINTQLNTGSMCGVCCNIFSADFPPKLIPSFSWVGSNVIQTYKLDKAFEAMEAMMLRRDVPLTDEYRQMMTQIFESRTP